MPNRRLSARSTRLAALFLGASLVLCVGSGSARAQILATATDPAVLLDSARFYGGAEYLAWWVGGAPLSVPLISTGPIDGTHHGFLVNSESQILYGAPFAPARGGNDVQEFQVASGTRLTLGVFLDDARRFALEGSGFMVQPRGAGYAIQADQNGLPIINIPLFNTVSYAPPGRNGGGPPAEDGLPAALPVDLGRFDGNAGVFTGSVHITNTLQLWGADLTGVAKLYQSPSFELSGLAGFRVLGLSEAFGLVYQSVGVSGVYVGTSGRAFDSFKTTNRFYGATIGVRGRYSYGPFSAELTGRLGLGVSDEVLTVTGGFYSANYISPYRSGPEGVFAQPANEGRSASTHFAVVPELQAKIGYDVTPWMRLSLGYDLLYDSNVIRPGDQINRNLPKGQTFNQGGVAPSTTSPTRLFRTTDFLAQGLTLGVAFRF